MTAPAVPRIEIQPDADALASAVAGALLGRLSRMEELGQVPHIALTGGTIARRVHAEVARHHSGVVPDMRPVDWSKVSVWWGDERFVAADSPDRNAGQAREDLLDALGDVRLHEVASADDVATAEDAAASYDEALRARDPLGLDILMLGVGPDGHVASLFPGHPALAVSDRLAVAVHDSPKPPPDRVSMTFAALNQARAVWFLVSGEEKAQAVARALADHGSIEETPARGVVGREETIWFLDTAAASLL